MTTQLLAPVRLGIRLTVGVLKIEARILEDLLDRLPPREAESDEWVPEDARSPVEPTGEDAVPSEAAVQVEPELEPEPAPAAEPEAPAHLDEEPELVAEFSDPGAEEGAGPEIHVEEPWEGYRQMSAADIRDRLGIANAAELAVVQLYESGNRSRQTVLDAVERRSKELANAPR